MMEEEQQQLQQAYDTLALPNTATKEEVEEKYFLLLKKKKMGQPIDEETVTRAYRLIVAEHLRLEAEQYDQKHYAGSKSRKAIDDFWHKYKTHVIVSVLALAVLIVGIQSYLDKRAEQIALSKLPPSNLDVMFVGEFQQGSDSDSDAGAILLEHFPDWQRIKVFVSYNPSEPKSEFDIAATQKNMLNLITEIPDVYITDSFNFELLTKQGAFLKLDDWSNGLPAERLITRQAENDDRSYVYGIDLSDAPAWEQLQLYGTKERIIALRFDTENAENSLLFVKRLLGME